MPWEPPAPPLAAQGEDAEECPGQEDKSLGAPQGQAGGQFHFHGCLEKRVREQCEIPSSFFSLAI